MTSAGGAREGARVLTPGSRWVKEEEEMCAELGVGAATLRNGTAAVGNECVVGSGAHKGQVLADSWGIGPNHLHCRPGQTPSDFSYSKCIWIGCTAVMWKQLKKRENVAKYFLLITASISKTFEICIDI